MNRKHLLIFSIISLLTTAGVKADDGIGSRNLVDTDRIWNYQYCTQTPTEESKKLVSGFHFQGQKIIADKKYEIFRDGENREVAYLRQEDGKVYLSSLEADSRWHFTINDYFHEELQMEYLLYDFNCVIGDTFMSVGFDDLASGDGLVQEVTVTEIKEISWGGNKFKALTLKSSMWENDAATIQIISGVGPNLGILSFPQFGNPTSGMRRYWYQIFNMTNAYGKSIFDYDDYKRTLAVDEIGIDCTKGTEDLFDLFGRRVGNPIPGTLYIREGKKVIYGHF